VVGDGPSGEIREGGTRGRRKGKRAGTIPLSYARAEPELKKEGKMGRFLVPHALHTYPTVAWALRGGRQGSTVGTGGMRKEM